MTTSGEHFRARVCICDRPLLADETCLRCGRSPALVPTLGTPLSDRPITWTRARVARAFRAFAFFRGRAPVVADWSRRIDDWPPLDAVERLFGTLEAAAEAAGMPRR
jgi:hypothetical protein